MSPAVLLLLLPWFLIIYLKLQIVVLQLSEQHFNFINFSVYSFLLESTKFY